MIDIDGVNGMYKGGHQAGVDSWYTVKYLINLIILVKSGEEAWR